MTNEAGKNNQTSLPSPEELGKMSFDDLVLLRDKLKGTKEDEAVAPYEHKAFVKQYLGDAPDLEIGAKALGLLAAIPGYQLKKLVSRKEGETPASMDQLTKSLEGVGEALHERIVSPWERVWNKKAEEKPATPPPEASKSAPAPWERQWNSKPTVDEPVASEHDYRSLGNKKRTSKQRVKLKEIMDMKFSTKSENKQFHKENAALIQEQLKNPNLNEETRKNYMAALGE